MYVFPSFLLSFFASYHESVNILGIDTSDIMYVHRYHPYFELTYKLEKISNTYLVDVNLRSYETSSQEDEKL